MSSFWAASRHRLKPRLDHLTGELVKAHQKPVAIRKPHTGITWRGLLKAHSHRVRRDRITLPDPWKGT